MNKDAKLLAAAAGVLIVVSVAITALAQEKDQKQAIADIAKSVLYKEAGFEKAKLKVVNNVPVLHLYGTGKDMGKQYGTILKKLLVELADAAKQLIANEQEETMARLLAAGVEKFIPQEYVAEMKAISKVTGIDYSSILIANALGEVFRCSTIAAWGERTKNSKLLFGRNLGQTTLPGISDKIACVTVYHPKGKNSFANVGVAGLIGAYSGINDKGLSIGNTTSVNAKQEKAFQGIPSCFLYRHLLEKCSTVEDVKKELKNYKHNILRASTLTVCDSKGKAIVAELGPGGVAFREPKGTIIYATNHFLTKEMKSQDVPCWRYAKFEEVEKKNKKIDIAYMKEILNDVIQKGVTLQTMVFEPADRKIHVAFHKHGKPAAETKYSTLAAGDLFPGPAKQKEKLEPQKK